MWRSRHTSLLVLWQRFRASGGGPLFTSRRGLSVFFDGREAGDARRCVPAFSLRDDHLDQTKTIIDKRAFGIPFHLSDAEVVDRVCRHHGTSVEIHQVARYMLPFWLINTATTGSFKADILQQNPTQVTQQHCLVWVEGPLYDFSYPFGEYMSFNQISASYVEPMRCVEACLTGTHIPSMLISRFELLKELEAMKQRPKIIPFTMSTNTALSLVEKRISRKMLLNHVEKELHKFHGSFLKSNITLQSVSMEALSIRPVFLPLVKLMVSTASHQTPLSAFVCGVTGKVVGPVLHVNRSTRLASAALTTVGTLLALAPFIEPGMATAMAIAAGVTTTAMHRYFKMARFLREWWERMEELRGAGILNFPSDSSGYRWCPEDEERQEYEYREELRRDARKKKAFEQRIKEEAARDRARQQGHHFDPRNRHRTDLENTDPLGYYELLELKGKEFSATPQDIARAFRKVVRLHHPDVSSPGEAEKKKKYIQRVIEAYKVLHDPKTKKAYDQGEMRKKASEEG